MQILEIFALAVCLACQDKYNKVRTTLRNCPDQKDGLGLWRKSVCFTKDKIYHECFMNGLVNGAQILVYTYVRIYDVNTSTAEEFDCSADVK